MSNASIPAVEAAHLTRRFGDVVALDDVSLTVARGEFLSLLGPSGCGKTTLLRILAGLDFPDAGTLRLAGQDCLEVPAHRRPTNTVFQSYALFPHLTVFDNIAFGLRMRDVPSAERQARVRDIMELARISDLAARKPGEISGGQKQRVALARALVNQPEVLLLDEPLGALDLKLRKELQQELRAVQKRTGITFIYVTHDQDEALSMSDRIAVMNGGRIVQAGRTGELYERPRTRFVAEFLGGCNLLRARVQQRNGRDITAATPLGTVRITSDEARDEFHLAIRPEKIVFGPATSNQFEGVVTELIYTGAETHALIRVGNELLRSVCLNTPGAAPLSCGEPITLSLPAQALIVLED